jgi:MFS transporter, NNP family, nitrate/nitrite transporter
MFMALMILFFAPDSPTGAWKDRHLNQTAVVGSSETPQSPAGHVVDTTKFSVEYASQSGRIPNRDSVEIEKGEDSEKRRSSAIYDNANVKAAEAALIKKSTIKEAFKVTCSLPTLTQCVCYFVTFGCELAINGVLSAFYIQASGKPAWSQSHAGDWAAMYGLLNIVARPLGGYIADSLYPVVGVEGKKFWMIFCIVLDAI